MEELRELRSRVKNGTCYGEVKNKLYDHIINSTDKKEIRVWKSLNEETKACMVHSNVMIALDKKEEL